MRQPFDSLAEQYDNWYDTPEGKQIFETELDCLKKVCPTCQGRWLEIGVGTGRFASGMGIREGIDPSSAMLELAASRDIITYQGSAEQLPFDSDSFDGILLAFSLCFVVSPLQAISQCHRILKENASLLIGMVPANSSWGILYQDKKKNGHPIYSYANFLTIVNTVALATKSGFKLAKSASTLFCKPDEFLQAEQKIETGLSEQAGFSAILFTKSTELYGRR